jgi:hypothetical protein
VNEPTRHHFEPAGYIGLLRTPPARRGTIQVWTTAAGRRGDQAEHVAHLEDFYRADGDEPLAVENLLRQAEKSALQAIRAIDGESRPPTDAEVDEITSFVALQLTRSPGLRQEVERFASGVARLTMEMTTSSDEIWESTLRRLEAADPTFTREGVPSRESMAEFVRT